MNFKKMITAGLTLATVLGLAACGNNSGGEETVTINVEEELAAEPTGEQIVLATNNAGDERTEWLQSEFSEAGFNVEIVELGGADVTSRVIAEVEKPTVNVAWGPSSENFDLMAESGALYDWTPTWVDNIGDYNDDDSHSYAYELQPKLWIANPDQYNADNSPSTVNDLYEDEAFHGKYAVPTSFGGATNRAIIASILGQYLDPEGDLGVSDEGWEAITAFFDNGVKTPEGENDYQNMIDGTTPITYSFASGLYGKAEEFGESHIMYFENGQPDNVNEVGIVNNDDAAVVAESLRLADFIGSSEFMGAYAANHGSIVANADAVDQMTDVAKNVYENYESQDLDWDTINESMDDWVAKIELEIY